MIYFDNAATSYYRPACVKQAVSDAIDRFGNPSRGAYDASLDADRCMFMTRLQLSSLFGAEGPDCVSFTMNATQALNTAIMGVFASELTTAVHDGSGQEHLHLIVSLQEHNSVLRPAYRLREMGVQVHFAGLTERGCFDIDDYRKIIRGIREQDPEAKIVTALAHGSNVTGSLIPLREVSELCRKCGSLLIIDAAQTAGIIPIDMKKDGIDILCFSGHKALMGPQGTGAVITKRGLKLEPLMVGGSGIRTFLETMPEDMPAHLEAGTQNSHSIAGLGAALTYAEGKREGWRTKETELKRQFLDGIRDLAEAGEVKLYGAPEEKESLPTVSFNVKGCEAGDIADRLWRDKEIAVRAGGHCAPLIHRFFGTEKRGIVRASFSHENTKEQVQILIDEIRCIGVS